MGSPTTKLILSLLALSLSSCAHKPIPADSFCQLYTEVIVAKGDGSIKATSGVKRRLLVNEKLYEECPKGAK
jgi:hypothetical protein